MAEPPGAGAAEMAATLAALLLAAGGWQEATAGPELRGLATYYSPGLMEDVAVNRRYDMDGYLAGVALNRAGDLGRAVWLRWSDGSRYGPFLVVDCAGQGEHYDRREQRRYVVEVPAWVARMRGFYGMGPEPVTVWFNDPLGKVLLPL